MNSLKTLLCIVFVNSIKGECDVECGTVVKSSTFHSTNGYYKYGGIDGKGLPIFLNEDMHGAILPTTNENGKDVWAFIAGPPGTGSTPTCITDGFPEGSPDGINVLECDGDYFNGDVTFTCGCEEVTGSPIYSEEFEDLFFESDSPTPSPGALETMTPTGSPTVDTVDTVETSVSSKSDVSSGSGNFRSGNFSSKGYLGFMGGIMGLVLIW